MNGAVVVAVVVIGLLALNAIVQTGLELGWF